MHIDATSLRAEPGDAAFTGSLVSLRASEISSPLTEVPRLGKPRIDARGEPRLGVNGESAPWQSRPKCHGWQNRQHFRVQICSAVPPSLACIRASLLDIPFVIVEVARCASGAALAQAPYRSLCVCVCVCVCVSMCVCARSAEVRVHVLAIAGRLPDAHDMACASLHMKFIS